MKLLHLMFYQLDTNTKNTIFNSIYLSNSRRPRAPSLRPCLSPLAWARSRSFRLDFGCASQLTKLNACGEGETREEALTNCRWHCRATTTTRVQIERERGKWREGGAFVHVAGRTVGISRKQASKRALRRRRCVVGVAASARCASDWAYLSGALHCELWIVNENEWESRQRKFLGLPVANWGYGKDLRINGLALSAFSC